MADKITIEIDLDTLKVDRSLNDLEKKAQEGGKKIGNSITDNIKQGFTQGFGQEAFRAVASGFKQIGTFIKDTLEESIKAALEDEKAFRSLAVAMANVGDFSTQAMNSMARFTDEMSSANAIAGSQINNLLALSKTLGLTNDQAQMVTKAAIDLSAATGRDLDTSVRALAVSLEGNGAMLSRMLPQLRGLGEEAFKSGEGVKFVLDQFSGTREKQLQTIGGQFEKLQVFFDEWKGSLGRVLINSADFSKSLKSIVDIIIKSGPVMTAFVVNALKPMATVMGFVAKYTLDIAKGFNSWQLNSQADSLDKLKTSLVNNNVELKKAQEALARGGAGYVYFGKSAAETIPILKQKQTQLESQIATQEKLILSTNDVNTAFEDMTTNLKAGIDSAVTSFTNLDSAAIMAASNAQASTEGIKNATIDNMKLVDEAFDEMVWANAQAALEAGRAAAKGVNDQINQVVNNLTTNGFSRLGAAFKKGGDAFKGFGADILNSLGDLAINIGKTLIASAISIKALKSILLAPQAALVAGLALVTVGGFLKAIAGGGGAGAEAPTSGAAGAGAEPSIATSSTQQLQEREAPKTGVTVNVSGIITNPRETAQQIADLLKDGFDTNALNISPRVA